LKTGPSYSNGKIVPTVLPGKAIFANQMFEDLKSGFGGVDVSSLHVSQSNHWPVRKKSLKDPSNLQRS